MLTSTPTSFWNFDKDCTYLNSKNIDLLKISSVNPAPIVSPTQVNFPSDLIGSDKLENMIKQENMECNGQFISNRYSLLAISHSPILEKNQAKISNIRNPKYQCPRTKHFRRKVSSRSHVWNDAASSISSSSGPINSHAATDGEKSPINSHLQSNEDIVDSLSVENLPRLNLNCNYKRLMHMTIDGKNNQNFTNNKDFNRNLKNNKHKDLGTRSLSPVENYLKNLDTKSESKFPIKPEFTTLAPCKGRINLTILCQFSKMTILLKEGDNLRSMNNAISNPFVRIQLVSNLQSGPNVPIFDTEVFPNTTCPIFDKSFSFYISNHDYYKRIVISAYQVHNNDLELSGCMSFGIKKFQAKTQVSGWYYLLKEEIGYRKHLKAGFLSVNNINSVSTSQLTDSKMTTNTNSNVGYQIIEVKLVKGSRGFGFTLCGGSPVYVSQVDVDSSAELAGIHPGDMIIKIDNFNVSESSTEAVVRMFRMCSKSVKVTLSRSPIHLLSRPLPAVPLNMHNSKTYPCIHKQLLSRDQSLNLTTVLTSSNVQTPKPVDSDSGNSGYDPQWESTQKSKSESKSVHFNSQVVETNPVTQTGMKTSQSTTNLIEYSDTDKCAPVYSNQFPARAPGEGSSNPNKTYSTISGIEIINRLQYQGHLKKVDFTQMSTNLEIFGPVSLKEGNCLFPVQMFLFSQVLLIGQHEPDGYITIIKEPIYCSKICYANIPAFCYDEIILQYINEVGRKQFIYFQATNSKEWLSRIQRHMIYHCNSWMSNIA